MNISFHELLLNLSQRQLFEYAIPPIGHPNTSTKKLQDLLSEVIDMVLVGYKTSGRNMGRKKGIVRFYRIQFCKASRTASL